MNQRAALLLSLVVCLAAVGGVRAQATPKPAAGMSPTEVARGHFRLAIDSFHDGDLDTALIEFKRAYAAQPNYRILYNLGQVSQELRDYPAAERYYVQYLKDGESQLEAARKQEVEYELAKVRVRIASIHVTCNVRGAEVFVDDVSVGHTPLSEPIRVSTGQRHVTGRAPGFVPFTQVVDAAGGETLEVPLDLVAAVSGSHEPVAERSTNTEGGSSHARPLAVGLLIGTGALAVGAGITAVLAANEAADYRQALTRKTSTKELHDLSDGAKTKALVCDVLLGATVVAGVASALVIWKMGLSEHEDVALSAGAGGLRVGGNF